MNDLEFRRRLFIDPNDNDVKTHAQENGQQSLLEEMQDFDDALNKALQVNVPEGLSDRIIANQQAELATNVVTLPWYKRFHKPFATAASVSLAVGIYFLSSTSTSLYAGEHALKHVYHEQSSLTLTEEVSLQVVNEKLAMFGAQFNSLPGKVTYATFCNFKGQKSLHIVVQSEDGPVTVFFVPKDGNSFINLREEFSDERFKGLIKANNQANTILVANSNNQSMERYSDEINSSLRWL